LPLVGSIILFVASGLGQTVVYNNGGPTDTLPLGPGNTIMYFTGTEDFTLPSTQTITAVRAWLYGNSGYADSGNWTIYANTPNTFGAISACADSPPGINSGNAPGPIQVNPFFRKGIANDHKIF
jgi:hypothetical protein